MFKRWRAKRQWHRVCAQEVARLAQDRDHLESQLFRLQKQYDDLMIAYKALVEHAMAQVQFPNVEHLFSEENLPEDKRTFLTPSWEDREGVKKEGGT